MVSRRMRVVSLDRAARPTTRALSESSVSIVSWPAAAFPSGLLLDEVKMGALLSFLALPLAVGLARWLTLPRTA